MNKVNPKLLTPLHDLLLRAYTQCNVIRTREPSVQVQIDTIRMLVHEALERTRALLAEET